MKPQASIIVPIYNAERYLTTCVRSLTSQTFSDINIILIDDGSTDKSGTICDKLAQKDNRILVMHKSNGGIVSARSAGISILPDEGYTTFCDADDCLPSNAIEKLYNLITDQKADIACGYLKRFWKPSINFSTNIPPSLRSPRTYEKDSIKKELLVSFFGVTDFPGYLATKIYRNRKLKLSKDFCRPVRFFQEDIAFNLQMALIADRISVMPDTVYHYRIGGGTSKFMPTFFEDCISLYRFKLDQIDKHRLPEDFKRTTAIELKNELFTWFEMYYSKYKSTFSEAQIKEEIIRCCCLNDITSAVNYPCDDYSGIFGFREMVLAKDTEAIFNLLQQKYRKQRFKALAKRILFSL
ncbi:MAG: glycosyltransferase family 2 protein [Clostridiales bacterium]|nr:glycosyltransferase family 2 protein [Clostridiales bacterium]